MIYVISKSNDKHPFDFIILRYNAKTLNPHKIDCNLFKKEDILISDIEEILSKAKTLRLHTIFILYQDKYYKLDARCSDFVFFYGNSRIFSKSVILGIDIATKFYSMKPKIKTRKCIRNIIFNKNHSKVLLLHRRKPLWGFETPGGGIEKAETELQALKRETYEEGGIKEFRILKRLKQKYSFYAVRFSDKRVMIFQDIVYISETEETHNFTFNDISAINAFDSGTWVPINKSTQKMIWPEEKAYIKEAMPFLMKLKKPTLLQFLKTNSNKMEHSKIHADSAAMIREDRDYR